MEQEKYQLITTSKNLIEFLALTTKPSGYNLNNDTALEIVEEIIQGIDIVYPTQESIAIFLDLMNRYQPYRKQAEKWPSNQQWYSHRSVTPFIKQFWMDLFDKKRPEIVPYRVIPNKMEVLVQLAKGSGLALCFDNNAKSFIKDGMLKSSNVTPSIARDVVLLANRKKRSKEFTNNFISLLTA